MAADLAADADFEVTVADVKEAALARLAAGHHLKTVRADLSEPAEVKRLAAGQDVVLGALSSVLGLRTLRAVIEGMPVARVTSLMSSE